MEYKMKWHKFLIYFGLWVGGVSNVINAVPFLKGGNYGDANTAKAVYNMWGAMKGLDVLMGIVFIALGIFCIVTRFALAGFKTSGPKMLTIAYAVNCAVIIVYALVASIITGVSVIDLISGSLSGLVASVAMMVINSIYYGKRSELFVN